MSQPTKMVIFQGHVGASRRTSNKSNKFQGLERRNTNFRILMQAVALKLISYLIGTSNPGQRRRLREAKRSTESSML